MQGECSAGVAPACDVNAECVDKDPPPGHTCTCMTGYEGNGFTCAGNLNGWINA